MKFFAYLLFALFMVAAFFGPAEGSKHHGMKGSRNGDEADNSQRSPDYRDHMKRSAAERFEDFQDEAI